MSLDDGYGLARHFVPGLRNRHILYDVVRPTWSADGSRFSYRRQTKDGLQYVLVDVAARSRSALFDPAALLTALAEVRRTHKPELSELQNVILTGDGQSITFEYAGRRWRGALDNLALIDLGPAPGPSEVMAHDGSVRAILNDHNLALLDNEGVLKALTQDGRCGLGYGDFISFTAMVSAQLAPIAAPPVVLWSPDSARLATFRTDLTRVSLLNLVQAVPPHGARPRSYTYPYPTPDDAEGARLELIFISRSGEQIRAKLEGLETFGFNPLALGQGWWEADSRHFLLLDMARDGNGAALWRIDSATGEAAVIVRETTPGAGRLRLDVGALPIHRLNDGRVIWWSEADGSGQLYLVDKDSPDSRRPITGGPGRVLDLLHVDEASGVIVFTAQGREPDIDPYYAQAYAIHLNGSGLNHVTPEPFNHDLTVPLAAVSARQTSALRDHAAAARGVSPDGRWFVDSFGAVDRPPISVLRDQAGNLVMPLETAEIDESWPAEMPLPEPVKIRALDGVTDLWGVLYRPPNFDPQRRYRLVEVIYGGPQSSSVPKAFRQTRTAALAEQIAGLGYVTFIFDGPGTAQRSRDFQFRSYGRIENCGGLDDHVAALRALAGERPWIDIENGVGLVGMSGGGYATVRAMAEFPHVYSVGVSICGNHDQSAYISQWGDHYQGLYAPGLFGSQANADVALKIKGKLFLIHGEMDDNVHPAHTLRVVNALIAADIDFDMLLVPNASHGVGDHPYVRRRVWDYFLAHLPRGEHRLFGAVKSNPGS